MKRKRERSKEKKVQISGVGITNDTLTSRGGLSLFVRYLNRIGIKSSLNRLFGGIRRSGKGTCVEELFKQVLCNFVDGTSRHLVHYDRVKEDEGYAGAIESRPEELVSSHSIKRFFNGFSWPRIWLFRRLLQGLFIWRMNVTKPDVIELHIDTMVMDNDEAEVRHSVEPTYRRWRGFSRSR